MAPIQSPEDLHDVNKSATKNSDSFVNKGTPETPLTGMKDKPRTEVSPEASTKLRSGLIK